MNEPMVLQMRKKNASVSTLWKHFRKMGAYDLFSDFILLSEVITILAKNKLPFSKGEVWRTFRKVDKDDYDKTAKQRLLKFLYRDAQDKGIFTNRIRNLKPTGTNEMG